MAECRLARRGSHVCSVYLLVLFGLAFGGSVAAIDQSSASPVPPSLGRSSTGAETERPSSASSGASHADAAALRRQEREKMRAMRLMEWEENAQFWKDEVAKDPLTVFYYQRLIFALGRLNRCDEMRVWTDRLVCLDPMDSYGRSLTGICFHAHDRFQEAIDYLQPGTWFDPSNFHAQRDLGYSLYQLHEYRRAAATLKLAADLRPKDFGANYWQGLCLILDRDYGAAVAPLTRAVESRPNDDLPWHWRGFANVRLGRYAQAIPDLENAIRLKRDDRSARLLLLGAYLVVGEASKAAALFPVVFQVMAFFLVAIYAIGLIPLLWLSFRPSDREFPNVFLSVGWTLLFVEGQIAFLLLLGLSSWFRPIANAVGAVVVADLPILLAAVGFARKRWGTPFARPIRFGGAGVVLRGFGLLLSVLLLNALLAFVAGHHAPMQSTLPIFRAALMKSPIFSAVAIGVVIPAAEEVLFRGLLFGALQKWFRPAWTIAITAFLFAAFHLQPRVAIQLFVFGCVLGWARARTGSIGLPILLHAVNNCVAVAGILGMQGS